MNGQNRPRQGSGPAEPSHTQLNPLGAMSGRLMRKGYLIPVAVVIGVWLYMTSGDAERFWKTVGWVLGAGEMTFIYLFCGKRKPWWLLVATSAFTAVALYSPLGDKVAEYNTSINERLQALFNDKRLLLSPGLVEEIFKAIPVFLLAFYGASNKHKDSANIGVYEPLDGILIAAASAIGFAVTETLLAYKTSEGIVFRAIDIVFGHAAYSGCFGYFIGLAWMKPQNRARTLLIGLVFSLILHDAWDTLPSYAAEGAPQMAVFGALGLIIYASLAAAILKARQISPTRSQNFATVRVGPTPDRRDFRSEPVSRSGLVVEGISGTVAGRRVALTANAIVMGRDPSQCQIVLKSEKVSRVHCSLRLDASAPAAVLQDCNSVNGTFMESGERLAPGSSRTLRPGDQFYLGSRSTTFQIAEQVH